MTTSGLRIAPQAGHGGAPSSSTSRTTSARGTRMPSTRQTAVRIEPCTSTTSREPASSWSVSTFCVTSARRSPRRSSSASARCAVLGSASASTRSRSP